jgi:hypothetical protein
MNRIVRRTSLALVAALSLSTPAFFPTVARAEDAPASQPAKKPVVDYKKLKELLPESLGDVKRAKTEGQKSSFGDQSVSTATGTYGDSDAENAPTGTLSYIDYGSTEVGAGIAGMIDIDQESDDEWTKTTKIGDYKALLNYNKKDKHGTVQTAVGSRIIVSLELRGVSEEQFKKAADELPLAKLAELVK